MTGRSRHEANREAGSAPHAWQRLGMSALGTLCDVRFRARFQRRHPTQC